MRLCSIALGVACALVSGAASAEDFTGFYARVNAGYARGQERERGVAVPIGGGADSDRDLPPSAAAASQAMEAGRTGIVRSGRTSPRH